jgi:hypothetical protein
MHMYFSLMHQDLSTSLRKKSLNLGIKLLNLTVSYKKCNIFYRFAHRLDSDKKRGTTPSPHF